MTPRKLRFPKSFPGTWPLLSPFSAALVVYLLGVFVLPYSAFSGERRFQSSVHSRKKKPSCISRWERYTLSRTKQGLKIVTSDSDEGWRAGFLVSRLTAPEAPIHKPIVRVGKSSGSETGPRFPHLSCGD